MTTTKTTTKAAAPKRASTGAAKKGPSEMSTKQTTGKAVTTVDENAGAIMAVPDWMKGDAGKGTENISNTEIETPRLKLLQAISPEIEAFDGTKVGEFFHTIAEQSLGKELNVTIIYVDQRYILWQPRWDGGGILARADDGVHWQPANKEFDVQPVKGVKARVKWATKPTVAESGLAEWGSSNPSDEDSPPAATKMFNLLVSLDDFPELGFAVVTLQRAGIKVARKLLGKLKIANAPSYGLKFKMRSVQEEGQEGPYQNYAFEMVGFQQDQERYKELKALYERFSKDGINIKDLEGAQEEGAAGTDTAAPQGAQGF